MTTDWTIKRIKTLLKGRIDSRIAVASNYYEYRGSKSPTDCDWRIFVLAPVEGVAKDIIMQETNKFLTFEEGYELGMIIEGDWITRPSNPKEYLERTMAPRLVNEILRYVSRGKCPRYSPSSS